MFIYSLRSEMAGIVVGDFERICLSRPCVLICSNVCFPSIFGLDGVEAGFAPEKVFDVIC